MTLRLSLCLGAAAFLAAACSTNIIPETKKIDYKSNVKRAPTLEVPPDLSQLSRDDRFVVPDTGGRGQATFSEYTSERSPANAERTSAVLPEVANIRVERDGNERWLVVSGVPSDRLWENVKAFWQELGFIIAVDSPEAGIMETDWAENRAKLPDDFIRNTLGKLLDSLYSTGERDKYRTRFEKGDKDGEMDIFISNRRMEEVYTSSAHDDTRWQPAASDPELEAEMLRRLMVRLGADEKRAEVATQAAQVPERARLTTDQATLEVDDRFDRAWRRTGLALDRAGFTVEDRDRSEGIYFVRYVDPEQDAKTKKNSGGWFSWMVFWDDKKPKANPQVQYRIHVAAAGEEKSTVQVLAPEGGVDTSPIARRIISLLYDELK